jgi:hypothetical protein
MHAYKSSYIIAHTYMHACILRYTHLELMFVNPSSECAECKVTGLTDCSVKL